ncbi:MAG: PAS domain S-box protein, partial [Candidatus Thorarchaeota archaeon]
MENLQLILSLIEGTNDLIHSIEPDHSFEFVNRSWLETLGYDDSDVSSLHLKDIIFPGDVKKHSDLISTILSGEYKTDVKTIFLTKDGD